jgi:hypothetical protein
MKVYYLNDTKKNKAVFVGDLMGSPRTLAPTEGSMFDVEVPDGGAVFVKEWANGVVLLSFMDKEAVQ